MVRFENKITENAVKEWADYYVDYRLLKRLLITEDVGPSGMLGSPRSTRTTGNPIDTSQTRLLDCETNGGDRTVDGGLRELIIGVSSTAASDTRFRQAVLTELVKVDSFYKLTVQRLEAEFGVLESQGAEIETIGREWKGSKEDARRPATTIVEETTPPLDTSSLRMDGGGVSDAGSYSIDTDVHEQSRDSSMLEIDHDLNTLNGSSSREILAHKSSKRAFVDLYRQCCFLQNYAILNYTAVIKIFKKHDKILVSKDVDVGRETEVAATGHSNDLNVAVSKLSTDEVLSELRRLTSFTNAEALDELMAKHEIAYADSFCSGSRDIAKAELLIRRSEYNTSEFDLPFRLGVRIGICLLLIAWVAWDVVADYAFIQTKDQASEFLECHKSHADQNFFNQTSDSIVDAWFKKDFPVYRGMFSLVLAVWMFGCLIFLWRQYRINYLFMLELDPRLTPSMVDTFWTAADMTILTASSFIVHFKVLRCQFPRWPNSGSLGIWPLIPFTFIVYKSLFPWAERKQIWSVARDVVIAPCVEVSFCMNFVGDVLTSLVKPFVDVAYTLCFYFSGDWLQHLGENGVCMSSSGFFVTVVSPLILICPYWFRFMQCLRRYADSGKRHPNLPNAFKYGLSMCVTIFGIFDDSVSSNWNVYRAMWIALYFSSTLYSWGWDVLMDWSALDLSAPGLLRTRRMLPEAYQYYIAIVVDLILRFFWTYTLIPINDAIHFEAYLGLYLAPFAAIAEIFRRSMWSILRLENEHLHNTAGYRKVQHIPLHFDTPQKKSIKPDLPRTRWQVALEGGLFVAVVFVVLAVAIVSK